jgi:hypothetical protein
MAFQSSSDSVPSDSSSQTSRLPLRTSKSKKRQGSGFVFIDYQGDAARDVATVTSQKSLMRAHVMRDYHRRQKQMKIENLKATMKKLPSDPNLARTKPDEKRVCPAKARRSRCCEGQLVDGKCPECQGKLLRKALAQVARSSEELSLQKYLGGGFVDPFASMSVPMTDTMNLYFRQCKI